MNRAALTGLARPGWGAGAVLGVGVAGATIALALVAPALAWLPVAVLAALPAALWLFRRPLLNLCVVLLGFLLIADYTEGLSLQEVLYGLYFGVYLAHWGLTRVVIYRAPILRGTTGKAALLFLLTVTGTIVLAVGLFEAPLIDALREWRMVLMVGLFFPVREAIERYRWAVPAIALTMALVWVLIALRNILDYRTLILNAVQQYQVGRGRVIVNDNVMMVSSVCLATWALFATRWKARLPLAAAWLLCFAALILTQSRSYWVAFLFAMGLLTLVAPSGVRRRIALVTLGGLALVVGVGSIFMADTLQIAVAGIINRFTTISDAATVDISFVSRLFEARGALARVPESPLLGHGPGAYFSFTDIIDRATSVSNFIHNGYVSLLFKYGLWGLGVALVLWLGAIWDGYRAFQTARARPVVRLAGLAAALCLCGYLLSALAAPPFLIDDNTFNMGLLTGVAAGAWARARREAEGAL